MFGSFLISSSDWSTSRFILEFQNTSGGVQPRFDIDGTNGFRLTNTSGGALSNSPFAPTGSNTYLVAFQIDFVGTDTTTAGNTNASTISFWVNPEAASTPPAIGNAATEGRQIFSTSRELLDFNRIDLRSISGDSTIDELRFGTTWGDVAPIPEPSAYGLIAGFLALGWVMVRRRS